MRPPREEGAVSDAPENAPVAPDPRRLGDLAILAPILGLILLAPPALNLIAQPVRVFGAPLITVYVFALWMAMILCAYLLARRLRAREDVQARR